MYIVQCTLDMTDLGLFFSRKIVIPSFGRIKLHMKGSKNIT